MSDHTFKIQVNDRETGEYITTHIMDGDNLGELAEMVDFDEVITVEEIDLDNFNY